MYMYRYGSICSVDIAISCLNMATSLFISFNFGAFAFLIWTVTGNDGEKEGVRLGNDPSRVRTQVTQTQATMSEHVNYPLGL